MLLSGIMKIGVFLFGILIFLTVNGCTGIRKINQLDNNMSKIEQIEFQQFIIKYEKLRNAIEEILTSLELCKDVHILKGYSKNVYINEQSKNDSWSILLSFSQNLPVINEFDEESTWIKELISNNYDKVVLYKDYYIFINDNASSYLHLCIESKETISSIPLTIK